MDFVNHTLKVAEVLSIVTIDILIAVFFTVFPCYCLDKWRMFGQTLYLIIGITILVFDFVIAVSFLIYI